MIFWGYAIPNGQSEGFCWGILRPKDGTYCSWIVYIILLILNSLDDRYVCLFCLLLRLNIWRYFDETNKINNVNKRKGSLDRKKWNYETLRETGLEETTRVLQQYYNIKITIWQIAQ